MRSLSVSGPVAGFGSSLSALKSGAKKLLVQLWNDDQGAMLSTEYVLVGGVLVTGVIPGLVAARNSINAAYATMGNTITNAIPSPVYSGYAIGGVGGNQIASVGGVALAPANAPQQLQAAAIAPMPAP